MNDRTETRSKTNIESTSTRILRVIRSSLSSSVTHLNLYHSIGQWQDQSPLKRRRLLQLVRRRRKLPLPNLQKELEQISGTL